VTHVFTVENVGDAELRITSVRSLCPCVTATISSKDIPPGGKAELFATFSPREHKVTGEATRTIVIVSNDPDEPQKRVTISAEVKED
jgi:hypothetical protein